MCLFNTFLRDADIFAVLQPAVFALILLQGIDRRFKQQNATFIVAVVHIDTTIQIAGELCDGQKRLILDAGMKATVIILRAGCVADVPNLADPLLGYRASAFSGGYFTAKVVEIRTTEGNITVDFYLQLRNLLAIRDVDGVAADLLVLKHDDAFTFLQ